MKWFTKYLIKVFVKSDTEDGRRKEIGYLEGYFSVIINILLAALKGVYAILTGSIGLLADAAHTLSDVLTSVVVVIGFKVAYKPADEEHPFGHGRMEAIATLIIAVMLFAVGIEFFKGSIERLLSQKPIKVNLTVIIIVSATILIKEINALVAKHLAKEINSKTIEADFWHHRSDSLSTIFVLVGIIGSMYGIYWLDGAAGIIVSLFLFYVSFELTKTTVNTLLGQPPDQDFLRLISDTAMTNSDVKGVHDITVHKYGQVNLITLHVEISDKFTAMEIHDISEDVQAVIEKNIPNTYALVHPDPLNTDHKDYNRISNFLDAEISNSENISSYHDLRIVGEGRYSRILFDMEPNKCLSESEMRDERRKLAKKILKKFAIPAIIKIEQKFKYSVKS